MKHARILPTCLCFENPNTTYPKRENKMLKTTVHNFSLTNDFYYQLSQADLSSYQQESWNVSETISQLSYLTHSYFRYYGKFPSKIPKLILSELHRRGVIRKETDFVFDNYAGSGTTLVEAKLLGYDSYGIDINPFAVLASQVKTRNYPVSKLRAYWEKLSQDIQGCQQVVSCKSPLLNGAYKKGSISEKAEKEIASFQASHSDASKWFSAEVIAELAIIKTAILSRPHDANREFFELAFFAIIRRVSTAYDGEVRPHVNHGKRKRKVIEAYQKKVEEMLSLMEQWNIATQETVPSDAFLCNNADKQAVSDLIRQIREKEKKTLGLVISHPPYLNCFDYLPVFKLGFLWSSGFSDIYHGYTYQELKDMELRSYPASTSENIQKYFRHNERVYKNIFQSLRHGGYCCIVIGDCTIKNHLFPVHKAFIPLMEAIGFETEKIVYRSTAYGMGKYAYRLRADYDGSQGGKKDAILFFKKP